MKTFLALFFSMLCSFLIVDSDSTFRYDETMISQAFNESKESNKPILVYFGAEWCLPCKVMQESTFSDGYLVEALNHKYVTLQIDVDSDSSEDIVKNYKVVSLPSFHVLNKKGKKIKSSNKALTRSAFYQFIGVAIPMNNDFVISNDTDIDEVESTDLEIDENDYEGKIGANLLDELSDEELEFLKEHQVVETKASTSIEESNTAIIKTKRQSEYVQAGVFKSLIYADRLRKRIEANNINVRIVESIYNDSESYLYKVLIGPVKSDSERYDALSDLSKIGIRGFSILRKK